MSSNTGGKISRRAFTRLATGLAAGAVGIAAGIPALAMTQDQALRDYVPDSQDNRLLRRISSLKTHRWQDHFDSIANDAILCDTNDRALHYWGADGFYRIYPTSVPLNDSLTRRGRTSITLKRPDPEWRPTANMLERNPDLPRYVEAGPNNPLGVRALNLTWPAYRIHGTNDIRKIGRQSSNGCIGLYNEHIIEVYDRARVGTPVLLI
jgi:hypothetical protein